MSIFELSDSEKEIPYYRFRALDLDPDTGVVNAIEEIRNNYLFFQWPHKLNDPFECCYKMTPPTEQEYLDEVSKTIAYYKSKGKKIKKTHSIDDYYESLQSKQNILFQSGGIVCFTPNWKNQLMWSYYSGGHSGVCIEYDIKLLIRELRTINTQRIICGIGKIKYEREYPIVPYNDEKLDLSFWNIICSKDTIWKHEKEVRCFILPKNHEKELTIQDRTIQFKCTIIKRVLLGLNISESNESVIRKVCYEHKIPVRKIQKSLNQYIVF